jgi:hypothetical protein
MFTNYVISLNTQPTLYVIIHNQCSDFILIDQGRDQRRFGNGAYWNWYPGWNVNTGNEKCASLIPFLATFEGAIMYELRKKHVGPDNRRESTHTLLFIAWKFEGYKKFYVFAQLIECNKWFNWNTSRLEEYYQRYANQLSVYTSPIKDTWLMPDGTVLMTELELDVTQRNNALNMTISEGIRNEHTRKPEWINLNR